MTEPRFFAHVSKKDKEQELEKRSANQQSVNITFTSNSEQR
jgi:hypothetical protein